MHSITRSSLVLLGAILFPAAAQSQITVTGLTDQTVYADTVTFRVVSAAGYTYNAYLDGGPVPVGVDVTVNRPEYHELLVERRLGGAGAPETSLIQFIIRSSERNNSEWGLRPWVPYISIPSASPELEGAVLEIVVPSAFPAGLEIPVVALVETPAGKRVGVNGFVTADAIPESSIQIFRGVGSGFLPPQSAGQISYAASLSSLSAPAETITVEGSPTWTPASGNLPGSVDWGQDARVSIGADLTVPAGAVLTIGAGSIIRLAAGVEIHVNGSLVVNGTRARPVVFTPATRTAPWGGIRLRTAASRADITGAILTGSGSDPDWFDNTPDSGSSHRDEEPLIYLGGGARANLTDSYLVHNQGQGGHGEGSFLTMTRCVIQRAITSGQYNGGSVTLNGCALIEFPAWDAPFEDNDNDGLYLTGGAHSITDTLIGWTGDDGIDAGSGSGGSVQVRGCWFESSYHESMAWSEDRLPTVSDTVAMNSGQGLECGFGSPDVVATRILSTANLSGVRFGDNYDWDYEGSLNVTESLVLYNYRDVWGRAWDDWTEHLDQMDIRTNYLTRADPNHPQNSVWNPAADASRLEPFMPSPGTVVGLGFALRTARLDIGKVAEGLPVRASKFSTAVFSVDYDVVSDEGPLGSGRLTFVPGQTVNIINLSDFEDVASSDIVRVTLRDPVGAELTGFTEAEFVRIVPVTLIAAGADWKYLDNGSNQMTAWREPGFNDASWSEGPAELGFGDDDEETEINGGPSEDRFITTYFRRSFEVADPSAFASLLIRLVRDDGAVVYLNGEEVFRSNLPEGTVVATTLATTSSTSETAFFTKEVDTAALVAGTNVIAVEVHQAAPDSSDLGFNLELIGQMVPQIGGTRFIRGDSNGDLRVDISDPIKVLLVLFAGDSADCDDALDGDDDGQLVITDAVYVLNHLFRGGPAMPAPYPEAGDDTTADQLGCDR
jgi:hypothetical protein